jgi:transcriptional regulator with XRE-family HTH domain
MAHILCCMVTRIGPKQPRRNFLAAWRKKRGLTQEQLAERVSTYKGQISNYESGTRKMGFEVQAALAEALDIEPTDLFRDPERPSADELLRDADPQVFNEAIEIIKVLVNRRKSA